MWQKIQSTIAVSCILVYICATVFAAYHIYKGVRSQQEDAQKEFSDLKDYASRASVLGFLNTEFCNDIRNQLVMSKTLQGIIIYGPNGNNFAVEKSPGTILYSGEYPRFSNQFRLAQTPLNGNLIIEGVPRTSISAVPSIIDYNKLLSILRTSLLAVLIASVISFSTLILDVALVRNSKKAVSNAGNNNHDHNRNHDHSKNDDNAINENTNYFTGVSKDTFDVDVDDLLLRENGNDSTESLNSAEPKAAPPKSNISFDKISLSQEEDEETPFDDLANMGSDDIVEQIQSKSDYTFDILPVDEELNEDMDDTIEKKPDDSFNFDNTLDNTFEDSFDVDIDEFPAKETALTDEPSDNLIDNLIDEPAYDLIDDPDYIAGEPEKDNIRLEIEEPLSDSFLVDNNTQDYGTTERAGLLAAASKFYESDNFGTLHGGGVFNDLLDEKLINAIKKNKDLALVAIESIDPGFNYRALHEKAETFFKPDANIFENENQNVFIVLPDTDIDDALKAAQEFHRQLSLEQPDSMAGMGENTLLIGIAGRTARDIMAARLISECEHALGKAREDPVSPIVAFKVD
ncbi:MAG: hypothetical protein LBV52_01815 [Spirochaetaceae bacterium]|jgi:hypothetical protein|nr:hypothetical protein [Spirochaetaceae bacterium]